MKSFIYKNANGRVNAEICSTFWVGRKCGWMGMKEFPTAQVISEVPLFCLLF
jgi:hypothetical protein